MISLAAPVPARPACSHGTIRHNFYAQDPLAEQLMTTEMDAEGVSPGPSNDRLEMSDGENEVATPDENGDMLYLPNDPRFDQVQTFVAANRTLEFFERHLGRQIDWAFGEDRLKIHPHAGEVLNAFYSREDGSINFATHQADKYNKKINLAHSAEVVAHEAGHALLDAVRPEWLATLEDATGGYHESIGDILSFLTDLEVPRNLEKLIRETDGDLTKENSVARLAEEVGRVYHNLLGIDDPDSDYLRNAVNDFVNAPPETLPPNPPDHELGRGVHSYSRVFTGAAWDILASLNEQYQAQGFDTRDAIMKAQDTLGSLAIRGIEFSPVGGLSSYDEMASAILVADQVDNGGKNRDTLLNMFRARNIHPSDPAPVPEGLELPEDGTTPFGAQRFLEQNREQLELGEAPLQFLRATSNDRGETFLSFGYQQDVAIDMVGFSPLSDTGVAEIQGSLLLAFDDQGELFFKSFNPVTPEREKALRETAQSILSSEAAETSTVFSRTPTADQLFGGERAPKRAYLALESGRVVLKPSPVRD